MISHEVVKTRDNHTVEVFLNGVGGKDALGTNEAVYEKNWLQNLDIEDAEGSETDEPQF
jgi:hypothetical protein